MSHDEAAKRCTETNAYYPATYYLPTSIALLDKPSWWTAHYNNLSAELHSFLAELRLCSNAQPDSIPAELMDTVSSRAKSSGDSLRVRLAAVTWLTMPNKMIDHVDEALGTLKDSLGESFSSKTYMDMTVNRRITKMNKGASSKNLKFPRLKDQSMPTVIIITLDYCHVSFGYAQSVESPVLTRERKHS